MDDTTILIIAAAVLGVILLVALVAWLGRHRRDRHTDQLRSQAREHRDLAALSEAHAQRAEVEVDARVAQAKREEARAEEARFEAERRREEADRLRHHADELDPDVEVAADADADTEPEMASDVGSDPNQRESVDLRDRQANGAPSWPQPEPGSAEAQASSTSSRRSSDQ